MPVIRKLIITGRVQGVGFRAFVSHHANALGLEGFVRNRRDGTVEALISGPHEKVEVLIAECRKGPPASGVEGVAVSDVVEKPEKGFVQLPTV